MKIKTKIKGNTHIYKNKHKTKKQGPTKPQTKPNET